MMKNRYGTILLVAAVASAAVWIACGDNGDQGPGAAGAGGFGAFGGAAGTDASVDGASCAHKQLDFGKACNDCAVAKCCGEVSGCEAAQDCVDLTLCIRNCPLNDAGAYDRSCVQGCAAQHSGSSMIYNAMVMCLGDSETCHSVCPY